MWEIECVLYMSDGRSTRGRAVFRYRLAAWIFAKAFAWAFRAAPNVIGIVAGPYWKDCAE